MQRITFSARLLPRYTAQLSRPAIQSRAPLAQATVSAHRAYATSAPKEAEEASAQSGGSRSKDAAEHAQDSGSSSSSSESSSAPGNALGRTGGGEPLSSSKNAPPQPKVHNAKIPGEGQNLTKEQQAEVDKHNEEFDKRHDRAGKAAEDEVDKDFWRDRGGAKNEN